MQVAKSIGWMVICHAHCVLQLYGMDGKWSVLANRLPSTQRLRRRRRSGWHT